MAQFTNQASVVYNGIRTNSNTVTGEMSLGIFAWKDAAVDIYSPGETITYIISMQNTSTSDYNNLIVTDDLGAYQYGDRTFVPLDFSGDPPLYYIGGILQSTPTVSAGPVLVISGLYLPQGLSGILIYRVRVNGFAPLGQGANIENTAVIRSGSFQGSVSVSDTIYYNNSTVLTIEKAMSPTVITGGDTLNYTFTIYNSGAAAQSTAGIVISDTFNPTLDASLAVTLNGAPWAQAGNYTYNTATGEFNTVAGRITVPAASFLRDEATGLWSITPGSAVLTVSGIV